MITLLFLVQSVFADPAPKRWVTNPVWDGKIYYVQSDCPAVCVEIDPDTEDPTVGKIVGGKFVKDQPKIDARAAKEALKDSKKAAARDSIKAARNFNELQQALMDLLGIE